MKISKEPRKRQTSETKNGDLVQAACRAGPPSLFARRVFAFSFFRPFVIFPFLCRKVLFGRS